ncbi:hypothetical protein HN011_000868, partial [Eciton burchellii]
EKLIALWITSITLDTTPSLYNHKSENVIGNLHPKKALGYDFIPNQILQKLSEIEIKYIIQLCSAVFRKLFPPQWKIAQIIMIQKIGKSAELAEFYRPISLLPVLSKLFETLRHQNFYFQSP